MKTKLFSFFLALVASIGTLYAEVYSGNCSTYGYPTLTWSLSTEDSTLVFEGSGDMANWYTYEAVPWNQYRSYIAYISFPESLKTIGRYAFADCINLKSVTIPQLVYQIYNDAFANCTNLSSVTFLGTELRDVDEVFNGCTSLPVIDNIRYADYFIIEVVDKTQTHYTINEKTRFIPNYAFRNCEHLESIIIPDQVRRIGENAFAECNELRSITIGKNVREIGSAAFASCYNLDSVLWNSDSYYEISSSDGSPFYNSSISIGNITFGENVKNIPAYLCYRQNGLTSVRISANVQNIGDYALSGCFNLRFIYNYADYPQTIYSNVMEDVDKEECTLFVPEGADYSYSTANVWKQFTHTWQMSERGICGDNLTWVYNTLDSILTISGSGEMRDYTNYGNTAPWSKYASLLSYVTFPEDLTRIGNNAFWQCTALKEISIPYKVTSIGESAFAWCIGLTTLNIPNGVTTLEKNAFLGCTNISSLTLPISLENIASSAFYSCGNLKAIYNFALTPQPVVSNVFEYVNKSTCTLYIPRKSEELYQAADVWKDFENIRYSECVITFQDWNNALIKNDTVVIYSSATPPVDPTREGYTFTGWDKEFSHVSEDIIVTAQYQINHYRVEFRNWDNTLLKAENVAYQTAATPPANPTREWYTFIGWDKEFNSIISDLVVTALYEEGQTLDLDVLFTNDVDHGEISDDNISIKIPVPPYFTGFTFLKWVVVGGDLGDTLEIQAIYTPDSPTSSPSVVTNPTNSAQKLLLQGNIYILTDDSRTYTLTGQQVK